MLTETPFLGEATRPVINATPDQDTRPIATVFVEFARPLLDAWKHVVGAPTADDHKMLLGLAAASWNAPFDRDYTTVRARFVEAGGGISSHGAMLGLLFDVLVDRREQDYSAADYRVVDAWGEEAGGVTIVVAAAS